MLVWQGRAVRAGAPRHQETVRDFIEPYPLRGYRRNGAGQALTAASIASKSSSECSGLVPIAVAPNGRQWRHRPACGAEASRCSRFGVAAPYRALCAAAT